MIDLKQPTIEVKVVGTINVKVQNEARMFDDDIASIALESARNDFGHYMSGQGTIKVLLREKEAVADAVVYQFDVIGTQR